MDREKICRELKMSERPDREQLVASRESTLVEGRFQVWYQPQYDHSTGMLVGAEALVRWDYPGFGILPPGSFIPEFEQDGFIIRLDLEMFRMVCDFQRRNMEAGRTMVPISVNMSRRDLAVPDFAEQLEAIRVASGVPVKYLRLELTESAATGSLQQVIHLLDSLHRYGYVVEMDDFGSGYSSLNVLKDVNFDLIKLDMGFLQGNMQGGRGGTIVSMVVRMAGWLGLPVIAEGVETVEQADFMRSVGCSYVQGYLYAKPMPEQDFVKKLSGSVGEVVPQLSLIDTMDAGAFWSPESLETLIFSNYVGGAAIFEYRDGKTELLRVNGKYLQELGMNLSEEDLIRSDILKYLDEKEKKNYTSMLDRAMETGEEQECETWRKIISQCCGEEDMCIRTQVRMIGRSKDSAMFYGMIRNITAEKRRVDAILDSERRFKMASEQVNIYYWEYTVATKEMRPCFRCMRDLGLPALVTNYPEPAIKMGIFPPEVADMYRDWHKQIEAGVPSLEAVIPLTVGRVPFLVRYTTEFDETGRPVKAYGSAALVVDAQ